jgi:hypothetical protein
VVSAYAAIEHTPCDPYKVTLAAKGIGDSSNAGKDTHGNGQILDAIPGLLGVEVRAPDAEDFVLLVELLRLRFQAHGKREYREQHIGNRLHLQSRQSYASPEGRPTCRRDHG